jgi:hypothetical protein
MTDYSAGLKLALVEFYATNDPSKIDSVDMYVVLFYNVFYCNNNIYFARLVDSYSVPDLSSSLLQKYGKLPNGWPHGPEFSPHDTSRTESMDILQELSEQVVQAKLKLAGEYN